MSEPRRLIFRVSGPDWVVWWSQAHTMEDAEELARVSLEMVQDPVAKQKFMLFCQDALTIVLRGRGVHVASWTEPTLSPEHQRAEP